VKELIKQSFVVADLPSGPSSVAADLPRWQDPRVRICPSACKRETKQRLFPRTKYDYKYGELIDELGSWEGWNGRKARRVVGLSFRETAGANSGLNGSAAEGSKQ
jgi:hypothetical protein